MVTYSQALATDFTATTLHQRANELQLWSSDAWLRLLHYPEDSFKSSRSRIDSTAFFLSPIGATDPVAEGRAAIEVLASLASQEEGGDLTVFCRFPARFTFLQNSLQLDLPKQAVCSNLTKWLDSFDATGISLVFVDGYLNNPASMFGHTFLRVESREFAAQPLLSGSIGFAARTNEEHGFTYAFNGIFGEYRGFFSAEPYDEKVREYGAVENRNIWEEHLALSSDETRFLLLHIWELQHAGYEYYFIDENCSFQLLALLEVVRPDLHLTEQFPVWSMPVDTFQTAVKALGTGKSVFRPSNKNRIAHLSDVLSSDDVLSARDLALGQIQVEDFGCNPLQQTKCDRVLQLAGEYMQYLAGENTIQADENSRFMDLLRARNRMESSLYEPGEDVVASSLLWHGSSRVSFALGFEESAYFELGYRPVLHDVVDPETGYTSGAQIQILSPVIRLYPEKKRLMLESLELVDILSIPGRSQLFKPTSWKASLSLKRYHYEQGRKLTGQGQFGFGVSYHLGDSSLVYGLLGASLLVQEKFTSLVEAGPSVSSGIAIHFSDSWSGHLQGDLTYYTVDQRKVTGHISLDQRYHVDHNNSLRFHLEQAYEFTEPTLAVSLAWLHYF